MNGLPFMCRIRFGVTGIHFDNLEPSRPHEEAYQPLVSPLPAIVDKKTSSEGPLPIITKKEVGRQAVGLKTSKKGLPTKRKEKSVMVESDPGPSSVLSSSYNNCDEGSSQTTAKRKRSQDSSSSSSSSSNSDAGLDHSLRDGPSGERQASTSKNEAKANKNKAAPRKVPSIKPTKFPPVKKVRFYDDASTADELNSAKYTPPAKKVRFADMVEERTIPDDASDSSSSDSSNDSYTDPGPPIEPHDLLMRLASNTPLYASKASRNRSPSSLSWNSSDIERKIDQSGQVQEENRFERQKSLSPPHSARSPAHRTRRSEDSAPEPLYIVQSNTRTKETSSRPALRRSSDSFDTLREEYNGTPQAAGAPKAEKDKSKKFKNEAKPSSPKYKAPSAIDVENDVEYDAGLDLLFRDV